MASQQPRPSWFRFPFLLRSANPTPAPAPEAPVTRPPAPRAPPPLPQPAFMRPAPPPVASPPPAALAPPATVPSIPRPQIATPTPRSPAAPTAPPPRSPVAPTPAPPPSIPRSQTANPPPRSPPPAPVASPPPTVAPIALAAPAIRFPSSAPPTASPPPRSPSVSPQKYPIGKTSTSLPPTPAPKESQKTSTNVPFLSSVPASPKTKEQVPSSSIPTPVVQKPMTHSPTPTAESSPKVVKLSKRTLVQSPQIKPVTHPPSPLKLPPPQMKTATDREPKITAVFNGKREPTKDKGVHIKLSESEEYRMSAITLSGQNKGAIMELSASGPQSVDKNGNIISWSNGQKSSSGEGKFADDKTYEETAMESPQRTAFLNSNVQGVNNSIFYKCSSTHNDPGIHLSLSRKKDQWDQ